MGLENYFLAYRPVRPGTAIYNPRNSRRGTAGYLATSDGTDRWIVSAYHVLLRHDLSAVAVPEAIYQPTTANGVVAMTDPSRADVANDCAAAMVNPAVGAVAEILNLVVPTAPINPMPGMDVTKSGIATGVTVGRITSVSNGKVQITTHLGFPKNYAVSAPEDSGAAWVDVNTFAPVAIHVKGEPARSVAHAIAMPKVLGLLRLSPVLGP